MGCDIFSSYSCQACHMVHILGFQRVTLAKRNPGSLHEGMTVTFCTCQLCVLLRTDLVCRTQTPLSLSSSSSLLGRR